MKKILFAALFCMTQLASAGTVYRDRLIPSGVCLVNFSEVSINAAMIQDVYAGTLTSSEYIGFSFNPKNSHKVTEYFGVSVTLLNKANYIMKANSLDDAEKKKVEFLNMVKKECKN